MIKTFCLYLGAFLGLYLIGYYLHESVISNQDVTLRFNLKSVYLFSAITSFVLCVLFYFLSLIKKTKEQLGFIYLPTLVIKIGLFAILFKSDIFQLSEVTKTESLNLLLPIGLFLVLEVLFIARLLNAKG